MISISVAPSCPGTSVAENCFHCGCVMLVLCVEAMCLCPFGVQCSKGFLKSDLIEEVSYKKASPIVSFVWVRNKGDQSMGYARL